MKKVFAIVALATLGLASCKKDYTCACTTKDGDGDTISSSSETITDHRSDAKAQCEENEGSFAGYSVTCNLD